MSSQVNRPQPRAGPVRRDPRRIQL